MSVELVRDDKFSPDTSFWLGNKNPWLSRCILQQNFAARICILFRSCSRLYWIQLCFVNQQMCSRTHSSEFTISQKLTVINFEGKQVFFSLWSWKYNWSVIISLKALSLKTHSCLPDLTNLSDEQRMHSRLKTMRWIFL